jgi:hypothetical protein
MLKYMSEVEDVSQAVAEFGMEIDKALFDYLQSSASYKKLEIYVKYLQN